MTCFFPAQIITVEPQDFWGLKNSATINSFLPCNHDRRFFNQLDCLTGSLLNNAFFDVRLIRQVNPLVRRLKNLYCSHHNLDISLELQGKFKLFQVFVIVLLIGMCIIYLTADKRELDKYIYCNLISEDVRNGTLSYYSTRVSPCFSYSCQQNENLVVGFVRISMH